MKEYQKRRGSVKGTHNPNRRAYRHGTESTRVVMGGQKVTAQRPRVRSKDGAELPLPTLGLLQNEDPLNRALMSRLLSGVRVVSSIFRTFEQEPRVASKLHSSSGHYGRAMALPE